MHFSLATSRAQSFFSPVGQLLPEGIACTTFSPVGWGAAFCPDFILRKFPGPFLNFFPRKLRVTPSFTHALNDTNSRARDLDLASASSGVFNSSHLDFGHPFGRTDGRHACAIAAPLVTVGFAVPTFRVSWPLNLVFSSFRI